jgi:hypothetical protein
LSHFSVLHEPGKPSDRRGLPTPQIVTLNEIAMSFHFSRWSAGNCLKALQPLNPYIYECPFFLCEGIGKRLILEHVRVCRSPYLNAIDNIGRRNRRRGRSTLQYDLHSSLICSKSSNRIASIQRPDVHISPSCFTSYDGLPSPGERDWGREFPSLCAGRIKRLFLFVCQESLIFL